MSGGSNRAFDPRVIGALIVAGFVGFIGYWLLTAFAPELGSGRDGGAHALSRSATGFSGLHAIAGDAGIDVAIARSAGSTHRDHLLVLTPPMGSEPAKLAERIVTHAGPVLVILPKHLTLADPAKRGWVRSAGLVPEPTSVLPLATWGVETAVGVATHPPARRAVLKIDTAAPIALRLPNGLVTFDGAGLDLRGVVAGIGPVAASPAGRRDIVILADPDLLNNRAMADATRATAAYRLLKALAPPNRPIHFDVMLNGLGGGERSILRLAFTPPFLGLTLCFLAATILALWQGFVRFGPPWLEQRRVALGKATLVANSALFIAQARRVPGFAARYATMVRDAAARALHAPPGLSDTALNSWLDRFETRDGRRFSELAFALEHARGERDGVAAAAALGRWRKDVLREG